MFKFTGDINGYLDTYDEIWEAVLDYCRPYVSETSLTLWLNTMKFTDIENNIVP
jgi:hypothetical protein